MKLARMKKILTETALYLCSSALGGIVIFIFTLHGCSNTESLFIGTEGLCRAFAPVIAGIYFFIQFLLFAIISSVMFYTQQTISRRRHLYSTIIAGYLIVFLLYVFVFSGFLEL